MEDDPPRLVRVNGAELLELRDRQVGWKLELCEHEDGFSHERQDVLVELVLGAASDDQPETIEKAVQLLLDPEQAFTLGNLLLAAANQAPFLLLRTDNSD